MITPTQVRQMRDKALQPLNQPGSLLSPKPGMMDAGGNAPKPVLSGTEQQATNQPAITPQSEYKPMQDPVNSTNNPLSYQEALTQGRLNAPGTNTAGGGFGGYDPNKVPQGYDPRSWIQTDFSGGRAQGFSYVDPSNGQTKWAATEQDPGYQQSVNATRVAGGLSPFAASDFSNFGGSAPPVPSAQSQLDTRYNPNDPSTWSKPGITPAGANAASGSGSISPEIASLVNIKSTLPSPNLSPGTVNTPFSQPSGDNNAGLPGASPLDKVFQHFKSQLERERDQGFDSARANAASRGVFYGTPGTQMEDQIREQFGRGLGDLEANLLQNESQNEIQRLGLANNLFSTMQSGELGRLGLMSGLIPQDMESSGGVDPSVFQALASMFGGKQSAGGNTNLSTPTVRPVNVQNPMGAGQIQPASYITPMNQQKKPTTSLTKGKY